MTVTQIAELSGVSIGTVDRVLHNRGRVSPETQQKVQEIIEKFSYQPNILAQQLRKNNHYRIGLLMPEITADYGYWQRLYTSIRQTIENEFSAFSFSLVPFFFTRTVHTSLIAQCNQLLKENCNAYIIAPVQQEEMLALLEAFPANIPYCFVDSPLPEASPLFTVAQNPYKAGFLAGRLTELTATDKSGVYIAIRTHAEAYNQAERARGFCDWFAKKGKKAVEIIPADTSPAGIVRETEKLLSVFERIAGICTVTVETQFVADCLTKLGRKNDIAVTGFDMIEENLQLLQSGAIDCIISQRAHEQGQLAVQKLARNLLYNEKPAEHINIPLEIFFKENVLEA